MVRITHIYIKMIRFTEGKVLTTNAVRTGQPAQFSQLLHLYHHLDPTLHSQIACRVGVFLLSLVGSNWGPPTLPLAECRTAEGSTAPSLLRERNSPGSELCLRVENGIMSCGLSKSTDWGKSKALTVFFLWLVSD